MKVIKLIDKEKYTAKNGKEYCATNYYLELDNKKWVAIRPCFGNAYKTLDAVAEVVKR